MKKARNRKGWAKPKKIRKVWLIKPFTKVKPSGKIYRRKKEKIDYGYEKAQDWIA